MATKKKLDSLPIDKEMEAHDIGLKWGLGVGLALLVLVSLIGAFWACHHVQSYEQPICKIVHYEEWGKESIGWTPFTGTDGKGNTLSFTFMPNVQERLVYACKPLTGGYRPLIIWDDNL